MYALRKIMGVRRNSIRGRGSPVAGKSAHQMVAAEVTSLERSKGRRPEVWNCMRHITEAL